MLATLLTRANVQVGDAAAEAARLRASGVISYGQMRRWSPRR